MKLKLGPQPPSWIPRKIDKTLDTRLRRNMVNLDLGMSSLERDKGHSQMQVAFVVKECCEDAEVLNTMWHVPSR